MKILTPLVFVWFVIASYAYMIHSQGHQIVQGFKSGVNQIVAYRLFLSFDVDLVSNQDYLEVHFPISLRNVNTSYPLFRIFPHSSSSSAYSYHGLELYDASQLPSIFKSCTQSSTTTLVYFQLSQSISAKQLYIVDIIPEPNISLPASVVYSLDRISMNAISNPDPSSRLVYASSSNIATISIQNKYTSGAIMAYVGINIQYLQVVLQNINVYSELVSQNGGLIHLAISSNNFATQPLAHVSSCGLPGCVISPDALSLIFPFTGTYSRNFPEIISLSLRYQFIQFSVTTTILSKAPAAYGSSINLPDTVFASYSQTTSGAFGYINLDKMVYHWGLEKDAAQEISVFMSSSTKYVYNTITISFSSNQLLSLISTGSTEQYQLKIDLGSGFNVLESSCATTLPQISSYPTTCKQASNIITFNHIQQMAANTIYTVSFRVLVFSSNTFQLNSLLIQYCYLKECQVVFNSPPSFVPVIPNFTTNFDTSQYSGNPSWSSYLGDIQIISVADTSSESIDTLVQKAFSSVTLNQGGGIFVNRGIETLVFFLTIKPATLCGGTCSTLNKIIKMTMLANNQFLAFDNSSTSGVRLAAQNAVTSQYDFASQQCYTASDCYDGSSSEVQNIYGDRMNGKTVTSSTQTARYTLRCGQANSATQPGTVCGQMFQGKEATLNTFQSGMGGVFLINKVSIGSTFIPSRLSASYEKSLDFIITFSLENPFSLTNSDQTILFRTLINGYALSVPPGSSSLSFLGSYINLSSSSYNVYNPTLFRLRVTNPVVGSIIFIFLDGFIELNSFTDEDQFKYSCQVITQASTLAHFDQNTCLAYKGFNTVSSTNYLLDNLIIVSTSTCTSCSFLEIIIPVNPNQNYALDAFNVHVGYGQLLAGCSFPCGNSCFVIQNLVTLKGVSSSGPSLQTLYQPYLQISQILSENLTGGEKAYTYNAPYESINFSASASSSLALTFADSIHSLDLSQIKSSGQNYGAGLLLTCVGSDPFESQVTLASSYGTFPYQTGICYKLSFYSSLAQQSPSDSQGKYNSRIRFAVFCPFDSTSTPDASSLTIASFSSTSSLYPFFPSASSDADILFYIGISEKYGRNIIQQAVHLSLATQFMTPTISNLLPSAAIFNSNIFYSMQFAFQFSNFGYHFYIQYPLIIELEIPNDFYSGNYVITSFTAQANSLLALTSTFTQTLNQAVMTISPSSSIFYTQINSIKLIISLSRSTAVATLVSSSIPFKFKMYFSIDESPAVASPNKVNFSVSQFTSPSYTFHEETNQPTISATIDTPTFKKSMKIARTRMRIPITISSSTKLSSYNILNEVFHLNLGFLKKSSFSNENCLFYTSSSYSNLDHSIAGFRKFNNNSYIFSVQSPFALTSKTFFLQCYGISLCDTSLSGTSYSFNYYDLNNYIDQITSTNKLNEIIYSAFNSYLSQPLNGMTISSVSFDFPNQAGLNGITATVAFDFTLITKSLFQEIIMYLPQSFDLSQQIYSTTMEATVIYLPDEHAVRFKISSDRITISPFIIGFAPVFITQSLLDQVATNSEQLYLELVNPFQNSDYNSLSYSNLFSASNPVIDFTYYTLSMNSFVENNPPEITIISSTLSSPYFNSISDLTIIFSSPVSIPSYSGILIYIGIGSQINIKQDSSLTASSPVQLNGLIYQQLTYSITAGTQITLTFSNIVICGESYYTNKLFSPVVMQIFQTSLAALTTSQIANSFLLPALSSSNSILNIPKLFFLVDSEGDQLHSIGLFYKIADNSVSYKISELNSVPAQTYPLINLDTYDSTTFISTKNLFSFSYNQFLSLCFKSSIAPASSTFDLSYHNPVQFIRSSASKFTTAYLNSYSSCKVIPEQLTYYLPPSKSAIIRIFFYDYCTIADNSLSITVTPTYPSTYASIAETLPLIVSQPYQSIMFTLTIIPSTAIGVVFDISFTISGTTSLQIKSIIINVASTLPSIPLTPNQDISSLAIVSTTFNTALLKLKCYKPSVLYFEFDIAERESYFTSVSDLMSGTANGLNRQSVLTTSSTSESTHQIGTIICQQPSSGQQSEQYFTIKSLRSSTNYSLKLHSSDGLSQVVKFQTPTGPVKFGHIKLLIFQDPSLAATPNSWLIMSQYLCYLAYYFRVPPHLLRFLAYPTAKCSLYSDTNPDPFAQITYLITDSTFVCNNAYSFLSHQYQYQQQYNFRPIPFGYDMTLVIEMESQSDTSYLQDSLNKLVQNLNLNDINQFSTFTYLKLCSLQTSYMFTFIENYGNVVTPTIELTSNSCSESLFCSLEFEQTAGSSILYVLISANKLAYLDVFTVDSFLLQFQLGIVNRFIYPLDLHGVAQVNFTISAKDTDYYLYYFMTDLTVSNTHYQFPGVSSDIVRYTTTYGSFSLLIGILIPLAGVAFVSVIVYYIKYIRTSNSKVEPIKISTDTQQLQHQIESDRESKDIIQPHSNIKQQLDMVQFSSVNGNLIHQNKRKVNLSDYLTQKIQKQQAKELEDVDEIILM